MKEHVSAINKEMNARFFNINGLSDWILNGWEIIDVGARKFIIFEEEIVDGTKEVMYWIAEYEKTNDDWNDEPTSTTSVHIHQKMSVANAVAEVIGLAEEALKQTIEDSSVPVISECDGKLGFNHCGIFITNPYISSCGRCEVDPSQAYGLNDDQIAKLTNQNDDEMEFWNGVEFESRVSDELNDAEMKFWNGAAGDLRNEMFILGQRDGIDASVAEIKKLSQER